MATRAGHAEVVLILLQAGANVNAKNCDGDTPLHVAASRFTDDVTTINHLLHHGESCSISLILCVIQSSCYLLAGIIFPDCTGITSV